MRQTKEMENVWIMERNEALKTKEVQRIMVIYTGEYGELTLREAETCH